MGSARQVTDTIRNLEYELAKQKAVIADFPNAKIHYYSNSSFQSKLVNQKYTKFDFERYSYGVWVLPYCEVAFTFDGKTEIVKVHSTPKSNRLVYLHWDSSTRTYIIKFSRLAFNLRNNDFRDDMLNACRVEIMSFIKNNPKYKMDGKHLEPRLKNLLAFT